MRMSAEVSGDGVYRYELGRSWDESKPSLEWIMLNPSTADADVDDPTIRRCIGFAKRDGFGSIIVHNLYALRATNPKTLLDCHIIEAFGDNERWLSRQCADVTVAAWGANPAAEAWMKCVLWRGVFRSRPLLLCLGQTASGAPRHPLYVKGDKEMEVWAP